MQIEKKGTGPWADVLVEGTVVTLTLNDTAMCYNCQTLQRSTQVAIDVVRNLSGKLVETPAEGGEYVANLIIPPARYENVIQPLPTLEEGAEMGIDPDIQADMADIDPAYLEQSPNLETVMIPLSPDDMETVRLVLWSVNEINQEENI